MTVRGKNLPASVAARLRNRARESGEDYQRVLVAYCFERFLYRLSQSPERERFVLKGAMLLRVWFEMPYRATGDLDLLRQGSGSAIAIREAIADVCTTAVEPDGIEFDPKSIRLDAIRADDEFAGRRVTLKATCDTARLQLQIDVGVGDTVWPMPATRSFPTMLNFPAPKVLAYQPESVVAEKFEAMVVLGDRNSRIKDFFDVYHLAEHFTFDRRILEEAIRRTFAKRATALPEGMPLALTAMYWESPSRPAQVRAFARRSGLSLGPSPGHAISPTLRAFLQPIVEHLQRGIEGRGTWPPGGPWQE